MEAAHRQGKRSPGQRLVLTLLLLLLVLPMVVVAIGWLSLRSAGARAWLLARVTARIERRYGVHVDIGDFSIAPWRGALELHEVAVRSPSARAFLSVRRLLVEVAPVSLVRETVVVRWLAVEAPCLDLGAPIPTLSEPRDAAPASSGRQLEVVRAEVRDGSIVGSAVPTPVSLWIAGWHAGGIGLDGSFRGGRLDARLAASEIVVEKRGGGRLSLALAARLGGNPPRSLELSTVELSGRGLSFIASGTAALDPPGPVTARFRVEAEPAALAPELAVGGRVALQGEVDVRTRSGHVTVQAYDLSLAAARALLPRDLFDKLEGASTLVDLDAQAEGSAVEPGAAVGRATLRLRRGGRELLRVDCGLGPAGGAPTPRVKIGFEASLLPSSPGRRHATGTLLAASWPEVTSGHLENGRLETEVPDLVAALAELRDLWPRLVPAAGDTLPMVGSLVLTAGAQGPLAAPSAELRAEWRPEPGSTISLIASGRPMTQEGEATLAARGVRLGLVDPRLSGIVSASVSASGSPRAFSATVSLDATDLAASVGGPKLDVIHLEVETNGREINLRSFSGAWGSRRFAGNGWAALDPPFREAGLVLQLSNPIEQVAAADIAVSLHNGTLVAEASAFDTAAGPLVAKATLPLAALSRIPGLGERLAGLPVQADRGPVHLIVAAPSLDSCALLPALGVVERPERVRAGVHAELWLDPINPVDSFGEVVVRELSLAAAEHRLVAEGPVTLRLAGGRIELQPVFLRADTARLDVEGDAWLARGWDPSHDAPASLVERFRFDAHGQVPAPLLNLFLLGGGEASGTLELALHAEGTPEQPVGTLRVDGAGAAFLWPVPYPTRVTQLAVEATLADGQAVLREGHCLLNGGPVEFTGGRAPDGSMEGQALFSDVRYRLDFGLRAVLSGELELTMPPSGRALLAGRVSLDRGWLDRDIDLEHELLPFVLGPPRIPGSETNPLDAIDLDISLDTVQGVRVKDNLADLRANWEPLVISGTAWNPRIVGRVDVEPGGLVFLAGQVFRVDRASATFTGDPATDPRIDFATTSSLQDPTIVQSPAGSSPFLRAEARQTAAVGAGEVLSSTLASLLGQRVGEALGVGAVTVRPVPVWGEADPTARLTVSRTLSSNAAFLVSLDLRNAQRQTYIIDLHGLRPVPTLQAQVFTNDQSRSGTTLQQILELGGPKRQREDLPVLHRIVVEAPDTIRGRVVRDAVRLRTGEAIPGGAPLDAEVEVAEALRSRGYPDAQVSAQLRPAEGKAGRQDLVISVVPGPRTEFHFACESLPAMSRRAVAALYRSDYYEAESLEEMRRAAVRALGSLGYLDPQVEATATRSRPADGASNRLVNVTCRAGRRVALAALEFAGVPPEDGQALALRFAPMLVRTELGAGLPEADARVAESLRVLGYRHGRVAGRDLSADGRRLVVYLKAGPRDRLARVSIVGVSDSDARRMTPQLGVHVGDPARADLVAAGAALIAEDFRARGFAEVQVKPVLRGVPDGTATEQALTYEVAGGMSYRLAELRIDGLRWTSAWYARRLADLQTGQPLRGREIVAARSRLLASGMFSTVVPRTEKRADGSAVVTFNAVERPRFTFSYGVRWESEVGASGVVEFIDHNLVGHAVTAGAQLRYEREDRSARIYLAAPGLFGSPGTVEAFAERRHVMRSGLVTVSSQATLQLSHPLNRTLTARVYGRYSDTHLYEANPNPFEPPYDVRVRHPYLGVQLVWDARDDPVMATHGLLVSTDLSTSNRLLGSDFRYLRWYSQFDLYRKVASVAESSVTWGQSVRVGLAQAYGQELIPDARFFAGGSFSVRGYDTESLGPTEDLGGTIGPVGGAALLVVNEELRLPLLAGITGVVFFDAGQVWTKISDFGKELAKSFGLGLRAATPIGPIRLDVARPLDGAPGAKRVRFTLGFGNVF